MDEKELAIRKIHIMLPKEEPLPKIESVSAEHKMFLLYRWRILLVYLIKIQVMLYKVGFAQITQLSF